VGDSEVGDVGEPVSLLVGSGLLSVMSSVSSASFGPSSIEAAGATALLDGASRGAPVFLFNRSMKGPMETHIESGVRIMAET